MSFDLQDLCAAVARHGRVARVVVAAAQGSSPREVGAAMLVWEGGQSGTIGGGALEFAAAAAARARLAGDGAPVLSHHALGPDLGQCCGGRVTLLTEIYRPGAVPDGAEGGVARPVAGPADAPPLSVRRLLAAARARGARPPARFVDGWMVEPVRRPTRALWVWGAGHVGRALVAVLAPLPDLEITWIDTDPSRFPGDVPPGVTVIAQPRPADLAAHAPPDAGHYILTYSHALDLELCHRVLQRGFGHAGVIGSATKWARFGKRLAALGHAPDRIARIACPIGDPGLGKHPAQIAIGVAQEVLARGQTGARPREARNA